MQSMVATQLGVQKISGITMYAVQEKKYYEPLPDIEVQNHVYSVNINTLALHIVKQQSCEVTLQFFHEAAETLPTHVSALQIFVDAE